MRRPRPAQGHSPEAVYPRFERFWTWLRLVPLGLPLAAPAAQADATLPPPKRSAVDGTSGRPGDASAATVKKEKHRQKPAPAPPVKDHVRLGGDMPAPMPLVPPPKPEPTLRDPEPRIQGLEGRVAPPHAAHSKVATLHLHPHAPDEPCRPAALYTIRVSRV